MPQALSAKGLLTAAWNAGFVIYTLITPTSTGRDGCRAANRSSRHARCGDSKCGASRGSELVEKSIADGPGHGAHVSDGAKLRSMAGMQTSFSTTRSCRADSVEPRWYAAYTTARHEKKVAQHLEHKSIECFLPLYEAAHRWKDRRVTVQLPLFPGYVFVRIPLHERLRVLEVPSVVHLVGSDASHPCELPEAEIESIRLGLDPRRMEPCPYLKAGDKVRVKYGPFAGLEGILLRKRDSLRLVLSIDIIMRSVAVEIDAADIDAVR